MQVFFRNLNGQSVCAQLVKEFTLNDFLDTAGNALGHHNRDETLRYRYTVSCKSLNVMHEKEFDVQKQYIAEGCNIFTLGRLLEGWVLPDTLQEIAEQQLQDELAKVATRSAECSICLDTATDCIRTCCVWICKEDFERLWKKKDSYCGTWIVSAALIVVRL
ncbi:MAG: hypothetical protein JOS17DRAFT_823124 [Linnemannia elongata]|nr:MAG: hypothetical protein JOS17DRAFT_823124 [Linnemannia elongata]